MSAEEGSICLTYIGQVTCYGSEECLLPPTFRLDIGEYSDWNGGVYLCHAHATIAIEEAIKNRYQWLDLDYYNKLNKETIDGFKLERDNFYSAVNIELEKGK